MGISLFKTNITKESIQNVVGVLKSNWVGLGPMTSQFEEEFANYVGARYCVALNSCTSALHLAVKLLNLPESKEVITTPMTFVSTNEVLLYERLVPVFADIEYGTLNIDVKEIESKITKKTGAIMIVHYGGQPCDLDEIYQLAGIHNLPLIQDCAHACGAEYKNRKIGSVSIKDLCCWSFHAVKNLPIGDGGAITTNNREFYNRLNKLRWLGIDKSTHSREAGGYTWRYDVDEVGYKYHMNDISAAIALGQLKALDAHNLVRNSLVNVYMNNIGNDLVETPEFKADRLSSNHIFHIKVPNRDKLMQTMRENDISCGVHYYPNHLYKIFNYSKLENAELAYSRLISLPLHTLLTEKDVLKVCEIVNKEDI